MHRKFKLSRCALALAVVVGQACSSSNEDSSPKAAATDQTGAANDGGSNASATDGKILGQIDLGNNHVVIFEELLPGMFSFSEHGRLDDQQRRMTDELSQQGPLAVWSALAPTGQAAPPKLVDAVRAADERTKEVGPVYFDPAALQARQEPANVTQNAHGGTGDRSNSGTQAIANEFEQDWFRAEFCKRSDDYCTQGWTWATSLSPKHVSPYEIVAFQGSEGTTTMTLDTDYYACNKSCTWLICDTTCAWKDLIVDNVAPGNWVIRTWQNNPNATDWPGYQFRENFSGGDGSTQVSLRVWSAPWTRNPPPANPPPPPASVCYRAHATTCTDAADGSPSSISHTMCADGCGSTGNAAILLAKAYLSQQTCIGDQWGCCEYEADQDFNNCGK